MLAGMFGASRWRTMRALRRVVTRAASAGLGVALTALAQPAAPALSAEALVPVHERTLKTPYQVTRWNTEEGLPQNTVLSLAQTPDGYLWAGTRYGLVRFDGVRFTVYQTELGDDPAYMDCRGLMVDSTGQFVVQTRVGLLRHHAGRFEPAVLNAALGGDLIRDSCAASEGGFWLVTGENLWRVQGGRAESRWVATNGWPRPFERVTQDRDGKLWLTTEYNRTGPQRCLRYDPATGRMNRAEEILGPPAEGAVFVHQDRQRRFWVCKANELLCLSQGQWRTYPARHAWGESLIRNVVDDPHGGLWILSRGDRQLHRLAQDQLFTYTAADGLYGETDLRSLLADREGNLWVGTGGSGLTRLQHRRVLSTMVTRDPIDAEVFTVTTGRQERVWLGCPVGLTLLQPAGAALYTNMPSQLAEARSRRVKPVLEDREGRVWMGVVANGLCRLEDGWIRPVAAAARGSEGEWDVSALFEDRAGTLWVGSTRGLLRRQGEEFELINERQGMADHRITGIQEGPDGSLWVGTATGGLHRFKAGKLRRYTRADGLLSMNAWPLLVEADGTLWVGTPAGLNRVREDQVRAVTEAHGLADNLAYALLPDDRGRYWSYCNRGLWRVRRDELNAVADGLAQRLHCIPFREVDGLAGTEGNGDYQPAAARLPNGELWFPTTVGVAVVDPARLRDNDVPPLVVIERVVADQEALFTDGAFAEGARRSPNGSLRLEPGRARVLEIRYTANTFVDSEKARFRVRLLGHDPGWRELDTRRTAAYTNLKPGEYRFQVTACNNHGYWSDAPAEFAFSLAPPFHETWPFRLLCVGAVAAIILTIHFRRVRHLGELHRLEHDRALASERGRIAKDLHDDLGSNLAGLALRLDVLAGRLPPATTTRADAAVIAQSVRALVEQLREVVWTVDPQSDTLEDFAGYLCHHAQSFVEGAGLRCRLDMPSEFAQRVLSADARHHLLLIVKEALNNAVRHAHASEVRLALAVDDRSLVLTVTDDGLGLASRQTPPSGSGRGLDNMCRRAEEMHGHCIVANAPGCGVMVTVRVPLAARDDSI